MKLLGHERAVQEILEKTTLPSEMIEIIMNYYVAPKRKLNEEIIKSRGKFSDPSDRMVKLLVDEGCCQLSRYGDMFSYLNFVDSWSFSMSPVPVPMAPTPSFYRMINGWYLEY